MQSNLNPDIIKSHTEALDFNTRTNEENFSLHNARLKQTDSFTNIIPTA